MVDGDPPSRDDLRAVFRRWGVRGEIRVADVPGGDPVYVIDHREGRRANLSGIEHELGTLLRRRVSVVALLWPRSTRPL